MTLKSKINHEIELMPNYDLVELYHFLNLLKQKQQKNKPKSWKDSIATLPARDANEILSIVKKEFNSVEGEW